MSLKSIRKKKPWNPFPLASLNARGISACAADVLRYLAIRSNHKGETVVGQRRMKEDMLRSKGYITAGLKELKERGILAVEHRCKQGKQADRHVISQSILPEEWRNQNPTEQDFQNPTEQDYEGGQNPTEQDFRNPSMANQNPTQQDETLQKNLTEELKPISQNQGRKEGRKERVASATSSVVLSNLPEQVIDIPATAGKDPSASPQREEPLTPADWESLSSEVREVFTLWFNLYGVRLLKSDVTLCEQMIQQYEHENVLYLMRCTADPEVALPFLTKVAWRDFSFWCDKFELNARKASAAKRKAEMTDKRPAHRKDQTNWFADKNTGEKTFDMSAVPDEPEVEVVASPGLFGGAKW